MAADDERYDHGGKFMNYATFESHLCGTFKSPFCVPQDDFQDLGDLLLPNSSYSISWNELGLDSDGEIRLVSDFDGNPVSPTLILNDYGRDGTAEENALEEVKGGEFPLELSKKVRESNHQSLDVQRQQWQNFPRVIQNFPDSPSSGSKLALDSDGEIWSMDVFERNPLSPTLIWNSNGGDGTVQEKTGEEKVSPTFILNNNGGDRTVHENTREEEVKEKKFPLGISKKVCKSSHRHFGGRRQQWQNFYRIVPKFPDSPSSGNKLALDSDGEIWSLDDFERNPVSPTLIVNNNCGYRTVEENYWEEKVSPTLILNNNGGDGTVEEKTLEEVKGRKFPLGVSKKVCKSSHPNFGCRRQHWQNFPRVIPNFPDSPSSGSESMSYLGGEIGLSDDFDRNPVSTTFFLNDNGGNGTVEENSREDEANGRKHPPEFSEKAPKSNHWSLACRRQQLSPARRCTHCQSEKTPQWRAGPMGPKTLCNACGVRYKSGRLLPEYRPAASPTFDSLKHSNFHRKIARNLIRNQIQWVSVSR